MGLEVIIPALISAAGAAGGIATFFSISTTTAFLLTAGVVGAGLNYLKNITPSPQAPAPQDFDYRVSRAAAHTPARFVYGRARVGGQPAYLEEFEWDDDAFVGSRDYQLQILLVSEGQSSTRGFVEDVWVNGRHMPYVPTSSNDFGQLRTSGEAGNIFRGSNTHLDDDITLWEGRKTTVEGAITDPSNPPRGVDILLNEIQNQIDTLIDRRGRRTQYLPNATFVGPEDGFLWEARWQNIRGVESNIKVFEHSGREDGTGSRMLSQISTWRNREGRDELTQGTVRWPAEALLKGVSAVMLELRDPGPRQTAPFLTGPPRVEYLVRGREITWPGQATPAWTENAAAVYYDWLVNVLGIDAATIDEDSFTAAYNLCNERIIIQALARGDEDDDKQFHANDVLTAQFGSDTSTWPSTVVQDVVLAIWNERYAGEDNAEIRYSINGVVDTSMDPRQVERQFNAAWGGFIVERGGKIFFEPGRDRPISRTLGESHVIAGDDPAWQVEPPLQSRATSVTASLTQSREHDWLAYSLPAVKLAGVVDNSPQDLGTWTYVAYPLTASRLMRQALYKANGGKQVQLTVDRGLDFDHFNINPTDRLALNLPTEGHDDTAVKWFVDRVVVRPDTTVQLGLREERPGTYEDVLTIPLEIGASARTGFGFGTTRAPPQNVTWVRTAIREQEFRDSDDMLYTVYRQYWEPRVDGTVPDRRVVAEYVHRRVAGRAVPREDGEPPRWGTEIEGVRYFPRFAGNPYDFYMLTRVPVLPTTVDQPHGAFNTDEVELRLRYDDGEFRSRWGDVVVVSLAPPVSIPDGLLAAGT